MSFKGEDFPPLPLDPLSPYQYFKIFFDDNLTKHIIEKTNSYSVQTSGKLINVTTDVMEQCLSILVRILLLNYGKVECIEPIVHKFHPSATSCQLIDLKKLHNISTAMTIKKILSSDPMLGRLWIQYWKDVVKYPKKKYTS